MLNSYSSKLAGTGSPKPMGLLCMCQTLPLASPNNTRTWLDVSIRIGEGTLGNFLRCEGDIHAETLSGKSPELAADGTTPFGLGI